MIKKIVLAFSVLITLAFALWIVDVAHETCDEWTQRYADALAMYSVLPDPTDELGKIQSERPVECAK